MKRKILIATLILMVVYFVWMSAAPRIRVEMAAAKYNPSTLKLRHYEIAHKSSVTLNNGIQVGLIHLDDGEVVKFWFVSKHIQPGLGLTRFTFEDRTNAYLRGAYCCEVHVTKDSVKDKNALMSYIHQNDGTPP